MAGTAVPGRLPSAGDIGLSQERDATVDHAGMSKVSPAVVTLLRHLAADVAGRRVYLSMSERTNLVAAIAQFDPAYTDATIDEDLIFRSPQRLRAALAAAADAADGAGRDAAYAVVATIQLALADSRLDDADLELVHLVGDAMGLDRARVDAAIERADGQARAQGGQSVPPWRIAAP